MCLITKSQVNNPSSSFLSQKLMSSHHHHQKLQQMLSLDHSSRLPIASKPASLR